MPWKDGRSTDLEFKWLTKRYGQQWEEWRSFSAEWISIQDSIDSRMKALTLFLETYLCNIPWTSSVCVFFEGYQGCKCTSSDFKKVVLQKTNQSDNQSLALYINHIVDFLDWCLINYFSEPNDNGQVLPLWKNPFVRSKYKINSHETIYNPLPYKYIQDLKHILCPNISGNFKDWIWAQEQIGKTNKGSGGDWYEVPEKLIDQNDQDCVFRHKTINRKGQEITIFQLWCPIRAMVLLVKLMLPLRTYQVRMMDSGEADTLRYSNGQWIENNIHPFALGNIARPYAKGVFKRVYDPITGGYSTALYINTNKTADRNKDESDRGYTIPWEYNDLLYWLQKLRNWQEKYNPIREPTECNTLSKKHTGTIRSKAFLNAMGSICFLFRDASRKGDDKCKPIGINQADRLWYQLLLELEKRLFNQGCTIGDGERLRFVKDYPEGKKSGVKTATLFPLHSLRVSLITSYAIDGKIPIPVISKLLAGHSRIIMTLHYIKLSTSVVTRKMEEAHCLIEKEEQQSLQSFLKDAELSQIEANTAFHNKNTLQTTLNPRNPIGWQVMHHGLCLMGRNTERANSTTGGCWNGGAIIRDAKESCNRVYGPVPHGPLNCVRCRFFITSTRYLAALVAHFNQLGYKAFQAAQLATDIEGQLEALKDKNFETLNQNLPFTEQHQLLELQRRYEIGIKEADEFVKDWIATFNLISRIMDIKEQKAEGGSHNQLVAVGDQDSVRYSLQYTETTSELLHLSLLCEDAEIYFDLKDSLFKTPAIQKRAEHLNKILMKQGFEPLFMEMDDEQKLMAGNAFMRAMAKKAASDNSLVGYKKAVGYLETEDYLRDNSLLKAGLDELTQRAVSLKSLRYSHNNELLELRDDY